METIKIIMIVVKFIKIKMKSIMIDAAIVTMVSQTFVTFS